MPEPLRRRVTGLFWRGALMLVIGGGAFFALESLDSSLAPSGGTGGELQLSDAPLAADTPELPRAAILDRRGDEYVAGAIQALAQQASLAASVSQEGLLAGASTALNGRYLQKGAGEELRFSLQLQGNLVGEPARLLRVSDGRFLWTDLQWAPADGEATPEEDRMIRRIDLRRVRREAQQQTEASNLLIAQRFGGLPMLLSALDREYDFAAPRLMQLEGVRVLAMVGQHTTTVSALLPSQPHHVVLAIEEASLAVRLIEYRAASDPLASSSLPPEERLRPSASPLLRIRFNELRSGVAIDDSMFVYSRPRDLPWRDETQRELRLVRSEAGRGSLASRSAASADAAPR